MYKFLLLSICSIVFSTSLADAAVRRDLHMGDPVGLNDGTETTDIGAPTADPAGGSQTAPSQVKVLLGAPGTGNTEQDVAPDTDTKALPVPLEIGTEGDEVPPKLPEEDEVLVGQEGDDTDPDGLVDDPDDEENTDPIGANAGTELDDIGAPANTAGDDKHDKRIDILSAGVNNSEDLQRYTEATLATQPHVTAISLTTGTTTMQVKKVGKIRGLIPYTYLATVSVHHDDPDTASRVKVRFPWIARFAGAKSLQKSWEDQLSNIGDDGQNALQKQQQTLQTMSNVSK